MYLEIVWVDSRIPWKRRIFYCERPATLSIYTVKKLCQFNKSEMLGESNLFLQIRLKNTNFHLLSPQWLSADFFSSFFMCKKYVGVELASGNLLTDISDFTGDQQLQQAAPLDQHGGEPDLSQLSEEERAHIQQVST